MEPFLGGTTEMVIELDSGTAGIPWELLDTDHGAAAHDQPPWAIRAKLLRKLRTAEFRAAGRRRRRRRERAGDRRAANAISRYPRLPARATRRTRSHERLSHRARSARNK